MVTRDTPQVLLIEDNLDDQLIARMAINRLKRNIDLYIATDAMEALQYLSQQAESDNLPSLILLNANVPARSGQNFLQALKNISHAKMGDVPVYVLSGEFEEEIMQSISNKVGISGMIPKPLVSEKLENLFAP